MKLCVTLNPRFISAPCSECGKRPDSPVTRTRCPICRHNRIGENGFCLRCGYNVEIHPGGLVHCLSGKYFCKDCCPECNPNRKLELKP